LRRLQAWLLFSLYLKETHEFSFKPKPEDGPVTVTRELIIPPEDRENSLRHYLPANRLWTPLGFSRFQKQPDARFTQATRLKADGERDEKKSEAAKG